MDSLRTAILLTALLSLSKGFLETQDDVQTGSGPCMDHVDGSVTCDMIPGVCSNPSQATLLCPKFCGICQAGRASSLGCDFEQQTLCSWSDDNRGIFLHWSVVTGGTGWTSGGPRYDHTTSAERGHYVMVSNPGGAVVQEAVLKSPSLSHTQSYCLRLWHYFPSGASGQLSLHRQIAGTRAQVLQVVKASESQTGLWQRLEFVVPPYTTDYSLEIVADVESSSAGSVAVDDVTLTEGSCTAANTPPAPGAQTTPPPLPAATTASSHVLVTGAAPGECQDSLPNCDQYGNGACIGAYVNWAQEHCPLFCGFCTPAYTTTPLPCVDVLPNCNAYGQEVCSNPNYEKWARTNCRQFCNKCGTTTRPPTTEYTTPSSGCFDTIYYCDQYGIEVCSQDIYKDWAERNCPKFCGLCGGGTPGTVTPEPCADKLDNCNLYGQSACTGEYEPWARGNCAKFCNYC